MVAEASGLTLALALLPLWPWPPITLRKAPLPVPEPRPRSEPCGPIPGMTSPQSTENECRLDRFGVELRLGEKRGLDFGELRAVSPFSFCTGCTGDARRLRAAVAADAAAWLPLLLGDIHGDVLFSGEPEPEFADTVSPPLPAAVVEDLLVPPLLLLLLLLLLGCRCRRQLGVFVGEPSPQACASFLPRVRLARLLSWKSTPEALTSGMTSPPPDRVVAADECSPGFEARDATQLRRLE